MTDAEVDGYLERLLDMLVVDPAVVEQGRERQEKVWRGEEVEILPLALGGPFRPDDSEAVAGLPYDWQLIFPHGAAVGGYPVPGFGRSRHFDLREQFYDPRKMLCEYLWELIARAGSGSDSQLSLRANYGCTIAPSVFGLECQVPRGEPPWCRDHLELEQILQQNFDDLETRGVFPRLIAAMRLFQAELADKGRVYLPAILGPFDTAHLLRGTDIFLDLYDHPHQVYRVMEKTTEFCIRSMRLCKEVAGEAANQGIYDAVYLATAGIRITEDSSVLLSPSMWKQFVRPFVRQTLESFGGAVVHFCGRADHLLESHLALDGVRGVNLGQPELYPYEATIRKFVDADKVYVGSCWPRNPQESVEQYFRRILAPLGRRKRGLIFQPNGPGPWPNPHDTVSLWHSLQA